MARLLLTRPLAASKAFLQQLQARGLRFDPVVISPLLDIVPLNAAQLRGDERALIFTSAHGVAQAPEGQGGTAYVVGQATAQAATQRGYVVAVVARDAEDLLQRLLAAAPRGPLLHLHGRHVRGDLADRLSAAGIETRAQAVYDQVAQALTPEAQALLNQADPVIVPLFSPRTAKLFWEQYTGVAALQLVALSPAVAAALGDSPKASTTLADAPDAAQMLTAIEGLMAAGR